MPSAARPPASPSRVSASAPTVLAPPPPGPPGPPPPPPSGNCDVPTALKCAVGIGKCIGQCKSGLGACLQCLGPDAATCCPCIKKIVKGLQCPSAKAVPEFMFIKH